MTTSRGGDYLDTASLDQLAQRLSTELSKQLYTERLPSVDKPMGSQDETTPFTHGQTALSQAKQAGDALTAPTMSNVQRTSGSQLYFLREDAVTHAASTTFSPSFDVTAVRRDFPILKQKIHGKPLIWLDNAATTQKPQQVIDAVTHFYMQENSNIHRGAHQLATQATDRYEGARTIVQRFLGAQSSQEIVFVRGATEAINLVAQTYGRASLQAGDEIVLTTLEHHANIVPWQLLCQEKGTRLRVVPLNENGEVILQSYEQLLGPRTRLVAISQVSNALGTIVPVQQMIALAHQYGARVLVDGAQAVPHLPVNVQELDADFYVFSGHKLFGPTGIGVLYGKYGLLEEMPPWQGGGNMIKSVTFEQTTFNTAPQKFEAGTGHIAGAVGLGAAIEYLERIGLEAATRYEHQLTQYAMKALGALPFVRLIGTAPRKVGVLSFVVENRSAQEVAEFLDQEGIAVRAGHHCAQPTMRWFGIQEAIRPSLAFYNTVEEIDTLVEVLQKCLHQQGKANPSHQYGFSSPHL